jgi:hypothetical protein
VPELERLHTALVAQGGRGSTVIIRGCLSCLSSAPLEVQERERGCRDSPCLSSALPAREGERVVRSTSAVGPLDPGPSSLCWTLEMEASSCSSRRKKGQQRWRLGRVGGGYRSCLSSPGRAGPPLMATGETSARFE